MESHALCAFAPNPVLYHRSSFFCIDSSMPVWNNVPADMRYKLSYNFLDFNQRSVFRAVQ